jgi:hypothetical protein
LSILHDISRFVSQANRDLPGMLITSKVKHRWSFLVLSGQQTNTTKRLGVFVRIILLKIDRSFRVSCLATIRRRVRSPAEGLARRPDAR